MKERKILFLRHGETDWNAQFRYQGSMDIPLNSIGERQASQVAFRIKGWSPERCFTSPQKRAVRTAEIAVRGICAPQTIDDLREISFGVWEGQPIGDIMKNYGDDYIRWREDPSSWSPPESEPFSAVQTRVKGAIDSILEQEGDRFLVVAHGGTIRAALASLFGFSGASVWKMRLGNCALTGVSFWDGRPALHFVNDCLHSDLPEEILSSLSVDL
ncbi:histidine phosphatase family protein [Dethiosulfovibrio salsuginis]|uniref:Alpha-ribazole phosphatase/probable phosphoglycerate mutase n=1 Tax=Dethiosulfovibrio salsuginis TaxID=561720 RepID=A0A1X7JPD7_9BACT|nr:histidine phosphatase family protein [Dethiosulfovibrio salsuginis]SMG29753.1 alpha-ribazole phosphatase/probable phosphoglycerate mutase [Dethiosulfovibrio salsuginis]